MVRNVAGSRSNCAFSGLGVEGTGRPLAETVTLRFGDNAQLDAIHDFDVGKDVRPTLYEWFHPILGRSIQAWPVVAVEVCFSAPPLD